MALPKINEIPTYELTIPSTKQRVKYRPFIVKEQKVLLIAMESQDQKQILNAIINTIEACMISSIDIKKLTSFDVEYIFTQIRAKSVGEKSNISITCQKCDHANPVQVNLEEIKIDIPKTTMSVKLNDQYTIKLRYPKYIVMLQNEALQKAETMTETLYNLIIACLDSLQTDEENIKFDDEPQSEIVTFLETLNTQQFNELVSFVQDLPKLSHKVEFDCISCKHHNKVALQGIQDFF